MPTGWIVFVSLALALPAAAQQNCASRAEIISRLEAIYSESSHIIGLTSDQEIMEIFWSKSGTWTILKTSRFGVSCIMVTGTALETYIALPGAPL